MNQVKEKSIFGFRFSSENNQISIFAAVSILLVIVGYVWFVSFGLWSKWYDITDYYDQLATAFEHGSLSLQNSVDPALLSLANPYQPRSRAGIDYPLDVSLYKGKYYLYFGPVPALILVAFKLLGLEKIGDQYLVFMFVSGMFVFQSLLIIKIRGRFFPNIPAWLLVPCIILGGLVSPLTWMLTEGRIYEASSAGGQFFFLVGFYFALIAQTKGTISSRRLLMSSISWALALGSRITVALPVGFVILTVTFLVVRTYFRTKSFSKIIYPIAAMGLPLAIGVGVLGWYNWARFGSVLETGFSYQLTTRYIQRYSQVLFSPLYVLPNSYDYLVTPPKVDNLFPFIQSIRGRGELKFPFITLPGIYHTRPVTGIIFNTPFVLFACLSIASIALLARGVKGRATPSDEGFLLRWIVISLLGSFLLGFGVIVSFFWVVTRYLVECMPSLILLSIIGFWLGYLWLVRWPVVHKVYATIGLGMAMVSIVSSTLLVLSERAETFQELNPVLWNQLTNLFSH
jgi:hypothetical protein